MVLELADLVQRGATGPGSWESLVDMDKSIHYEGMGDAEREQKGRSSGNMEDRSSPQETYEMINNIFFKTFFKNLFI